MKNIFILIVIIALFGSCQTDKPLIQFELNRSEAPAVKYPDVKFAVISDLHIYCPSLGSSGPAFEKAKSSDRKLLLDSIDLLDYGINVINDSGVSFVIISGDITKDGELINHEILTGRLKILLENGIGVYVIPGNHDVNSPDSVRFEGDKTILVPDAAFEDFPVIYADFGYNAAIKRDEDSLSYVVEPIEGLWLLAIDACRFRENERDKPAIVSGRVSQQTADWLAEVLKTAASLNKAVIAFMHHGVVEHWDGQRKLHPDYLIEDYLRFGEFLASWDVRLVFTGHYHAQDIVRADFGNKFIYDIQTGSLVTAPCPIRFAEIKDNVIDIRTETIVDRLRPGTDFADNAKAFVKQTVKLEALNVLRSYKVPAKDAELIADAVAFAYDAHYAGDENPALRPPFKKSNLGLWGRIVYRTQQYVLDGLWTDLPPADNNVTLEL